MSDFYTYPKTPHLQTVSYKELEGKYVVVEEKMDGTQVGISFDLDGKLVFQTRNKIFSGHPRELQFDILKQWANVHKNTLLEILGTRYVVFGEYVYAKHTVFYDALPHYFIEFDVLNKSSGDFLSTMERKLMFSDTPIVSAAVVWNGILDEIETIHTLTGHSIFKTSNWRTTLERLA